MLGTTWYERGLRYWIRRVVMVLASILVLALIGAAFRGFFGAIRQSSETGFRIALAVEIVYSLGTIVFLVMRTRQHWNDREPARPMRVNRATGTAGAVLGTLARTGCFIGQLFLVLASVVFAGLYVAIFIAMLTPETVWERPARLRMADLLASRGA